MTRRRLRLVHLGLVLTLALAGAPSTFGQTQRAANREWRSYAGDPGGLRYSALDQINRDNV
ncbi:MAG: hypothetical protein HY701_05905, partial [Gemmatimonadetes bacterium]|nr:hypothetical protein [Gemmatimonadota bacterium]